MIIRSDWRNVWKYYSTHAMVIYTAAYGWWFSMPVEFQDSVPQWAKYCAVAVAFITYMIAKLINQGGSDVVASEPNQPAVADANKENSDRNGNSEQG